MPVMVFDKSFMGTPTFQPVYHTYMKLIQREKGEYAMIKIKKRKIAMADWAYIIHEYVVPAMAGIVGSFIGLAIVLLLKLKTG